MHTRLHTLCWSSPIAAALLCISQCLISVCAPVLMSWLNWHMYFIKRNDPVTLLSSSFLLPRSGGGDLFYRRRRAETGSEARQRLIIARLDALSMCARPASSRDFDRLLAEGTLERVARTGHTLNWHVIASLCFSNGFPADAHALKRTGT